MRHTKSPFAGGGGVAPLVEGLCSWFPPVFHRNPGEPFLEGVGVPSFCLLLCLWVRGMPRPGLEAAQGF